MSGLNGTVIATNGCGFPAGARYTHWLVSHRNVFSPLRRAQLDNRGEGGRVRVSVRCMWPLSPCIGQPHCTARHIDAEQ